MSRTRLFRAMRLSGSAFLLVLLQSGCGPTNSPRAPDRVSPVVSATDSSQPARGNAKPDSRIYLETFDDGPGGWYGDRRFALPVWDGIAYCYSPWWTDANHAPPGAGYLHLLLWTYTNKAHYQVEDDYTRLLPYRYSRFAEEGHSRNLTNAKLTVRLRGDGDFKGAQMLFLVQAKTDKTTVNSALTGQPFKITRDWSEQTVTLAPDPQQWTCLGARHDMQDEYGCDDIDKVLADVNLDIIFILFPLKVVPAGVDLQDIHTPRAVQDYPVDQQYLPKGLIMLDTIKIEYPN